MKRTELLEQLKQALVVKVSEPRLPRGAVGVIIVDAVQGFTRTGNLADPGSMAPMVAAINSFISRLQQEIPERLQIMLLRDCHQPEVPEPPYPPHCIAGSGEELLDPELQWIEQLPGATVLDKDCINGFVGAMERQPDGTFRNLLVEWVVEHKLEQLLLLGDCTDICVSDLAVALLSARNHGLFCSGAPGEPGYAEAIQRFGIDVYVPGCATFDLDPLTLPEESLRHPGPLAQHVGLWLMASRGARLVTGYRSDLCSAGTSG